MRTGTLRSTICSSLLIQTQLLKDECLRKAILFDSGVESRYENMMNSAPSAAFLLIHRQKIIWTFHLINVECNKPFSAWIMYTSYHWKLQQLACTTCMSAAQVIQVLWTLGTVEAFIGSQRRAYAACVAAVNQCCFSESINGTATTKKSLIVIESLPCSVKDSLDTSAKRTCNNTAQRQQGLEVWTALHKLNGLSK